MTSSSPIVHHYSAVDSPRGFFHYALRSYRYVNAIADSRVLVWNFFHRSLMGRFRGSFGGVFWVLVHPIFQFLVYFLVFGILFESKDRLVEHGPDPLFAVYLFAGVLMFGAITEAASAGMGSIVSNANLVKKVAFPCELLPLTPVMVGGVVYLVGCLILLVVGLLTGYAHIGLELLCWPLLVACLFVFCSGLALVLAAANVFVRDISQFWPILSMAWFFTSPVFWRLPLITDKLKALELSWALDLLFLNPAYGMLLAQRQVFGIGPPDRAEYDATFPHSLSQNLAAAAIWSVLVFVVGYAFFMSRKHKFADLV